MLKQERRDVNWWVRITHWICVSSYVSSNCCLWEMLRVPRKKLTSDSLPKAVRTWLWQAVLLRGRCETHVAKIKQGLFNFVYQTARCCAAVTLKGSLDSSIRYLLIPLVGPSFKQMLIGKHFLHFIYNSTQHYKVSKHITYCHLNCRNIIYKILVIF